jgi:glycosyltransferase involved in cell wall biosynthesis
VPFVPWFFAAGRDDASTQAVRADRIAIVQGALPAYRSLLFAELRSRLGDRLVLASGQDHFEPSVTTDPSTGLVDIVLDNFFLFGRRLLYQRRYRQAIKCAQTIVVELNPRVLNTWLTLIEARLRGQRTVLWGHHLGRRPGAAGPRLIRRLQVGLGNTLLAYTDHDGDEMRATYPGKPVYVAPNATERHGDSSITDNPHRTDYLYVGRLTPAKRPDMLLAGFAAAAAAGLIPAEARLVLVGEGPLKQQLIRAVDDHGLSGRVMFVDGTFDSNALNYLYASAVAGTCGGYVGLNITQSLSRGVPFVYPAIANHSPEIALARPGFNAFPFNGSNIAAALGEAWKAAEEGQVDHIEIRQAMITRYSIESMVSGFLEAVNHVAV